MSPKFLIDLFCAPALENSENMYGLNVKEKDVQFGSRKFHSAIEKIYNTVVIYCCNMIYCLRKRVGSWDEYVRN